MKATLDSLQSTKNDPVVRQNLTETAAALQTAESNVRSLKQDAASISGSPQTRKQLADAAAQLRAAMQRAKSLLKP
jgi:alkylation response protein AidB-like acyl-CoA dehydrogenase